MNKIVIAMITLAVVFSGSACSKDKKKAEAPVATAETLTMLEAMYSLNDVKARDASTALTCKYVVITGNGTTFDRKEAEAKTSGQCNFAVLRTQATSKGGLGADKAAQIVSLVANNSGWSASAKERFDCAAYNISTNLRQVGGQDCNIKDRSKSVSGKDDALKQITSILGL